MAADASASEPEDLDFTDVSDPNLVWLQCLEDNLPQASSEPPPAERPSETPVVEPAPPASSPPRVQSNMERRYAIWADAANTILDPIRAKRGRQLRPQVCAGACAGLTSEAKASSIFRVKTRYPWLVDPSPSSFQWARMNGPECQCHFADLGELSATGKGFCFYHNTVCAAEIGAPRIHKYVAGFECSPYSMARTKRHEGTEEHSDAALFDQFLAEILRTDADEANGENVMGLASPESRRNPVSPLQQMSQKVEVKAPAYDFKVFFMDGKTAGPCDRRRIYIHLLHARVGGAAAHKRMCKYVQVTCSKIQDGTSCINRPKSFDMLVCCTSSARPF